MQEKLTYLVNIFVLISCLKFLVFFDEMSTTIIGTQKLNKIEPNCLYKSSFCKVIKGPFLAVPKIPNPVPNPAGIC